jgi:Family of unknown function (DUF5988)
MQHSGENDFADFADLAALVEVVLEGGPADLAPMRRIEAANIADGKLKIERLGGYEHFEQIDSGRPDRVVFRWSARTRIAE